MAYSKEQLDSIYRRSSGYCHVCHCKLARKNYNRPGARGAWHVEHSVPRAKGGTDRTNNLYAACIDCNCQKGTRSTRAARSRNGVTCAPLCPQKRKEAKFNNGAAGAVVGGLAGAAVAGPVGLVIGAVTGAYIGSAKNPDRV